MPSEVNSLSKSFLHSSMKLHMRIFRILLKISFAIRFNLNDITKGKM